MVTVAMNGQKQILRLEIDPEVVSGDDVEMLQDLIVAAVNDAKGKVEARVSEEMQKLTGGLNLPPGMSLPL
jgi:DNA-binding YbaB/EbfC family protein